MLLAALALAACSLSGFSRPTLRLGVDPVRDLAFVTQTLEQTDRASPHLLAVDIGQVTAGEFQAPLGYATFRPFHPERRRALLLAGVRGEDRAAVQAVLDLLGDLASSPQAYAAWDLDLIPLLNPWGFVHDRPDNAYGIDIDRDFGQFRSAEARLLRRFLREKRYDLVIDLREDLRAAGFAIGLTGIEDRTAADSLIRRLRTEGHPVADDTLVFLGPREGVARTPQWGLRLLGWFGQTTMTGYLRAQVRAAVCTLITPRTAPLEERIAMHRLAIDSLLGIAPRERKGRP